MSTYRGSGSPIAGDVTTVSLEDLDDVKDNLSPSDGQVLTYDTTNGWQAETADSGASDHTLLTNIGTNTHAQIDTHIANTSNPHSVSASDVGAGTAQWNANKLQGGEVDSTVGSASDGDILVFRSAGSDWVLEAKPAGGSNPAINDITDVTISAVADNEVLAYDSGSGDWINQTPAEAGLASTGHSHTESDISDLQAYLVNVVEDTSPTLGAGLNCNSNILSNVNEIRGANGGATDATYTFESDHTTGMYGGIGFIRFATDGSRTLEIESNGTLNVAGVTNYETLVTADDDIPNKKFVDDHTWTESDITDLGSYETADATILKQADVDDTPVNGVTTAPVSSNWAFDHENNTSNPHSVDSNDVGAASAFWNANKLQGKDLDSTIGSPSDGDILVFRSAGNDWILEAKPAGGSNPAISDITDITITAVADNEVLAFDNGTSEWINQTPGEAGLAASSHTHTESDITDLGNYAASSHNHSAADLTSGSIPDARVTEGNVTQHRDAVVELSINTQTGTTYTLVLGDAGDVVEMNNASANTLTVPPNSSVAFPIGSVVNVTQLGAGATTIAQGSGVTIRTAETLILNQQYAVSSLYKRGTNEWVLTGYLTEA